MTDNLSEKYEELVSVLQTELVWWNREVEYWEGEVSREKGTGKVLAESRRDLSRTRRDRLAAALEKEGHVA